MTSYFSLKDIDKIKNIVGEHMENFELSSIIFHHDLLEDIRDIRDRDIKNPPNSPEVFDLPSEPTSLSRTGTGYNCICWKNNIKQFCIPYKSCMMCNKNNCIRNTEGHEAECSFLQ